MAKFFYTFTLLFAFAALHAQNIPARVSGDRMVNDYAGVLTKEEEEKLELQLQQYKTDSSKEIIIVLTSGLVKSKTSDFASALSKAWGLGDNSFLLFSDIKEARYGFYIGKNLKETYPDWVIEKIESNYIKPHFRDKEYFAGMDKATNTVIGLQTGSVKEEDLKKDSSNGSVIVLILVVLFFFLIFPVLQFRSLKRSHFSTKPMDFMSTIVLMNSYGGSKNGFENFSKGTGRFTAIQSELKKSFLGGGGIAGSW